MIEAVNSVVSNAQLARVSTDQVATLNSFAADQPAVESVARGPVAPYVSPYVSVDTRFDTAVIQIRDSDTGDVLTQFPSEPTLQSRQAQAAREAQLQRSVAKTAPEPASEPQLRTDTIDTPTASTVQTAVLAQQSSAPAQTNSSAGAAQVAIAAFSAGAQSGQVATTTTVTA